MNDNKNLAKAITEVLKNQSRAEDHAADILNVIEQNAQHRSTRSLLVNKSILIISFLCLISAFLGSYKVYFSEPEPSIKTVWFDRQRTHPSESFAKVDEKFPAGYEIWEGKKLIERWHWKIENDPRTDQFGDFILRCVAKYSDDGAYIGFTEYQMSDYPTEQHEEFESLRKPDALVFHLSTKSGFVALSKPTLKAKWRGEIYLGAEKISDGFPHSKNHVHANMLIENQTDLDYVKWKANIFKFLQKDVVNAYHAKKDFEEVIKNAPEATQDAWSNFVNKMNQDCKATQAYIENAWNNRKIEDTANLPSR